MISNKKTRRIKALATMLACGVIFTPAIEAGAASKTASLVTTNTCNYNSAKTARAWKGTAHHSTSGYSVDDYQYSVTLVNYVVGLSTYTPSGTRSAVSGDHTKKASITKNMYVESVGEIEQVTTKFQGKCYGYNTNNRTITLTTK